MGLHSRARCRRTHNRTPAHTLPTKRMTRHFTTKSFLLVAALLVVAVSAAEAASGSRALLQVINIPLVGTVDFQNVAPFYGQIFSGLIPSDALPFGTDSIRRPASRRVSSPASTASPGTPSSKDDEEAERVRGSVAHARTHARTHACTYARMRRER